MIWMRGCVLFIVNEFGSGDLGLVKLHSEGALGGRNKPFRVLQQSQLVVLLDKYLQANVYSGSQGFQGKKKY
jgi:hypothetical protein